MAVIHSFVVNLVSLASSCRCATVRSRIYFNRRLPHCELMAWTFSVMLSVVRSFKLTGAAMVRNACLNGLDNVGWAQFAARFCIRGGNWA